ncbi:MAG: aldose epimerase family protein [Solirubrobacteraceae bacterium]
MASVDGFASVEIVSPGGTVRAHFVPDANMVCHSFTHRGIELLHTGRGVEAYARRGKTMGIPLLHPWANRLAEPRYAVAGRRVTLPAADGRFGLDPNGLPIHGALPGLLQWELLEAGAQDRVSARLDWTGSRLMELFPFVHELRLDVVAGDAGLELVTTLRPTGEDAVPVSFGYHPYLRPPGNAPRADWEVSLGASQRLVLDERMIPTGETEPLQPSRFRLDGQSWDDGLAGLSSPPEFSVSAGAQALTVIFDEGFSYAQVFAPEGQDFICFEPMTAPTNALASGVGLGLVEPGDEYRTAFSIAVTDN